MRKIYGGIRIGLAVLMIVLAALGVLVTSIFPGNYRGIPWTAWSLHMVVRFLCFVFRIRVHCADPERLRSHGGLVFPNHTSALDVLALLNCAPMRFLAAHDMRDRPLLGWTAANVGTVFVNRDSPRSRVAARDQVVDALRQDLRPPVVLFPEGRLGPGDTLFPFRHGAFGIVIQAGSPYLPCAIRYEPLDLVLWRAAAQGEGMWSSIWRMVQYTGHVDVDVILLDVVQPQPDDNARELARQTRQNIANALGLPIDEANGGVARTGLRSSAPPATPS